MLLVLCHAGGSRYAVEARSVSEVLPRVALHRVAQAPPWHAGLLIHRGRATPVVDLAQLAGAAACPARLSCRIVVLDAVLGGQSRRFGVLAERVDLREIEASARESVEPASGVTAWGRLVLDERGAYELVEIANLLPEERRAALFPTAERRS